MNMRVSLVSKIIFVLLFSFVFLFLVGCSSAISKIDYSNVFNRKGWNHTDEVIKKLDIKKGDVVVDLGAGDGYFSFYLAEAVGKNGKVYAIDLSKSEVNKIKSRVEKEGVSNIYPILASEKNPNIPTNDVDLIFMSNSYHHISERVEYFSNINKHIDINGRIAVLDTKKGTPFFVIPHGVHSEQIKKELKDAGYQYITGYDFLPFNNFEVFSK
ncbi:class I SAM-dependent methyltransferase [Pseudoalteromonas aurantia]|uniref:Methyltransferase domain-containing protein n=1 Tax=Pseudoalteromonas aurantia 208 TaxID=1314867 RepID=A0ABR9EES4_9GAMM|nr:class I SAM-dependent methyltransferase [Pseudoalteromonas aurantia]MBE0369480.1 hypothetical protein [Pseudoalteromonas aurantia 208]